MIRMEFGFAVTRTVGGTKVAIGGTAGEFDAGDLPGTGTPGFTLTETYTTQDVASAKCKSWIRQLQSSGVDAVGYVVGKPVGTGAATPVRALAAEELEMKTYERIDTIARGLRQRINAANTEADAGGAGLDADIAPDVPQPS